MPYSAPGPNDVHVNRPLTNISIAFMQSAMGFVADKVFPPVPVSNKSDEYWTIPRGAWFRDEFRERAPGTESAAATYGLDTASYNCKVWALHKDVDDQSRANQDAGVALDMQATEFLTQKGMIRKEVQWAADYFATNKWTFELDGAASRTAALDPAHATNNDVVYWNAANGTPIEDMRLMATAIGESTGMRPNVAVLGRRTYDVLVDHDDIIGRLNRGQTSGAAMANRDDLARLFEVDEVLVMDGVQNSADEGETDDFDLIGGKHAGLFYRARTPGLLIPSAGYTFNWTGYAGSVPDGVEISRFRMTPLKSDRVEAEMAWDMGLVSADLGASSTESCSRIRQWQNCETGGNALIHPAIWCSGAQLFGATRNTSPVMLSPTTCAATRRS